jgi:hypothetical protein
MIWLQRFPYGAKLSAVVFANLVECMYEAPDAHFAGFASAQIF